MNYQEIIVKQIVVKLSIFILAGTSLVFIGVGCNAYADPTLSSESSDEQGLEQTNYGQAEEFLDPQGKQLKEESSNLSRGHWKRGKMHRKGRGYRWGQGNSPNFVDDDGDGVCDHAKKSKNNHGPNFSDEDGDGICDNYKNRRCGGKEHCRRGGHGPGFTDKDSDGVCDRLQSQE